jgi:hypothetical protein
MHGDDVGTAQEICLAYKAGAGLLGFRFGQVRTPGYDFHIERKGVASQTRAETAETDDAE